MKKLLLVMFLAFLIITSTACASSVDRVNIEQITPNQILLMVGSQDTNRDDDTSTFFNIITVISKQVGISNFEIIRSRGVSLIALIALSHSANITAAHNIPAIFINGNMYSIK